MSLLKKDFFITQYKSITLLGLLVLITGFLVSGCGNNASNGGDNLPPPAPAAPPVQHEKPKLPLDTTDLGKGRMVSFDVTSIGRADPFMPYDEIQAYDAARREGIQEANAINSHIAEMKRLENVSIRELDDINPYGFNLPVPPTSLASESSAAAKITRTKVVGIMYNQSSPAAIINVDDKDYLVRQGDKIIGQEYKVVQINPNWITVSLGSNVYSAAIGELFSKDEVFKNQNDLYDLRNRFGGRKG